MINMSTRMVLVPGQKKRVLAALDELIVLIEEDTDFEAIVYSTSQIMPMVTNPFAYYSPKQAKKKRNLNRTPAMIREDEMRGK